MSTPPPQQQQSIQFPQPEPALPMNIPIQIQKMHISDNLSMDMNMNQRKDSDAFRMKYYQTLTQRRHSGQSAAKEIPSSNGMVLNNKMTGSPPGHLPSNQLSRSAPIAAPILVQRSAPINIPTAKKQSARDWAYAYARNSQHSNNKFYMNPKTENNANMDGFNQRYKNHNQLLGNADHDDDELDILHQFDPNNDDNDNDNISLSSKEFSTKFYTSQFPLTHSVDFEL